VFQLQRAIIRPTTERSPGTFSECALYGIPYSVIYIIKNIITRMLPYCLMC